MLGGGGGWWCCCCCCRSWCCCFSTSSTPAQRRLCLNRAQTEDVAANIVPGDGRRRKGALLGVAGLAYVLDYCRKATRSVKLIFRIRLSRAQGSRVRRAKRPRFPRRGRAVWSSAARHGNCLLECSRRRTDRPELPCRARLSSFCCVAALETRDSRR